MTQDELLKMMVTKEELPYNWCYCFNEDCQRKEECVRYLSRKYMKDDVITASNHQLSQAGLTIGNERIVK